MSTKSVFIPIKAYRYTWASKRPVDWPEAFFQILERFEDTERVLEGMEISIHVAEEGLAQLLVFRFCDETTRRRIPVMVRLDYWDSDLGLYAELEAAHSVGLSGGIDTGNRIFFVRQIKSALAQAHNLVIEVEAQDEVPIKSVYAIGSRLIRRIRENRNKNLAI